MQPTRKVGDRNKAFCSNIGLAAQFVSPRSVESHPTLPNHLQTQTTKSAPRSLRFCRSVRAPLPVCMHVPFESRHTCSLRRFRQASCSITIDPSVLGQSNGHGCSGLIRPHRSIAPTQAAAGEHQTGRAASLPCSSSLRSDSFRHTGERVPSASSTAESGYSLDYWSWPTPFHPLSGGWAAQLRAPLIPHHCWTSFGFWGTG
jgi:hypothetical protein